MEDELCGRIMRRVCSIEIKKYSYLTDDAYVFKKAKGTKNCVMKHKISCKDYKNCLENNEKMLRLQ